MPWDYYTNGAVQILAKRKSTFRMVNHGEQGFLRVRIAVDISKPLVNAITLRCEDGKAYPIKVQYEMLGNFYWSSRP